MWQHWPLLVRIHFVQLLLLWAVLSCIGKQLVQQYSKCACAQGLVSHVTPAYTPQKDRACRAGSCEGKNTLLNSLLSCV
jgi:hypothetical protein